MLDVLYNNTVCNLVYMTDLTDVLKESEEKLARRNCLAISKWVTKDLQLPQETALTLVESLMSEVSLQQRDTLERINYGIRLMQMQVFNLIEYQTMRY